MSDTSKSPMELSPAAPSPSPSPSPNPKLADPSSELGSEEANTLNLSNASSSTSKMDTSSASMVVNVSCESAASEEKSMEPKRKKIKLMHLTRNNNFITSEDYLELRKAYRSCAVEQVVGSGARLSVPGSSRGGGGNNNKPTLAKAIEKFAAAP
ncbi:hypothetical protein TYRP_018453 [Tyrophagus putrescentiae]|nr:hypothetical protein TYRP_018453 [Tyrophagus putrescentiae]